ncbi:hypothetical protein Scep_024200 [Stephania cephalantha]|uniref:Uncharacterized protein n=1 Tax=Stephania cephalantha TaxID=152367 RepID=A0AAP0HY82_9MAGN
MRYSLLAGGKRVRPASTLPLRARRRRRSLCHARRLRSGDDPHHVPNPRRPPLHGQRQPPKRQTHKPQSLRRGRGGPGGRRPPRLRLRAHGDTVGGVDGDGGDSGWWGTRRWRWVEAEMGGAALLLFRVVIVVVVTQGGRRAGEVVEVEKKT